MGGLGPGIGGLEILVIGLLALIVVGPKDLPLLMRKVGQAVGKARGMANEFRASFDEMARQTELDELRKEVDALRTSHMVPLGAEADAAFKDISADLNRSVDSSPDMPALQGPDEWPDTPPMMTPLEPEPKTPAPSPKPRKATAKPKPKAGPAKARKPTAKPTVTTDAPGPAPAKARKPASKSRGPVNTKLDL